tara:strand:- start:724 stop:1080 length:357 start_codon:yes stop_codon:yes gene_type:complete
MKMNDIVEGAMDDLGLKGHGSELDLDIDPNKEVFKNKQVSVQLKNITDYPKGGEVKTDDGKSIPVSQKQAVDILSKGYIGLAPVLGIKPKYARDPDAKDEVMKQMQTSAGLEKILAGI